MFLEWTQQKLEDTQIAWHVSWTDFSLEIDGTRRVTDDLIAFIGAKNYIFFLLNCVRRLFCGIY